MITVATVLKSGGVYTPDWVYALKRGLSRHLSDFRFACLTDMPGLPPIWTYPLAHGWPGWWSKVEAFRPALFDGPVLYLDLDTLPVGALSDIASYRGPFAMLNDFYQGRKQVASGAMAWTPGPHTEAIYHAFCRERSIPRGRSDHWYQKHTPKADRLQDLYPGQIVSLKKHARKGPPEGARLVCGHGNPRLSEAAAGWAHREWARWKDHAEAHHLEIGSGLP